MNRLTRTVAGIGGSLAALGMLVNWHNHFAWLNQWQSSPVSVFAGLALLGWLLRKAWLGLDAELPAGFFTAFLAWQLVHPIVPSAPSKNAAPAIANGPRK